MKMENLSAVSMYIVTSGSTEVECDLDEIDSSTFSIFRLYSFGNWKCLLQLSNNDLRMVRYCTFNVDSFRKSL